MATPKLKKSLPIASTMRRGNILLTEDEKMRVHANFPEQKYVSASANREINNIGISLKDYCERAKARKVEVMTFFHDHFFGGGQRELHLTHPDFIDYTKKISDYCEQYDISIGASVTNPLDLGKSFKEAKGIGGQHRFFAEGVKLPDGSFKFNAPISECWGNNKGIINLGFDRARLFTYTEENDGSAYLVIRPETIQEIPEGDYSLTISTEPYELSTYFGDKHIIFEGNTNLEGNRVFSVCYMDTPEMDYFHPEADSYIQSIIDMYLDKGVEFLELYSDEMHIQFDWGFRHFGPYEIPTRYMTESFQAELARKDDIFEDFDKALIYFGYDMLTDRRELGRAHTQHVMGRSSADKYRTFRLRKTYFEMLQDKVVEMCCNARDYIRDTYKKHKGCDPLCHGHATWQESPTCDQYGAGRVDGMFHTATQQGICTKDYTPDYVYSSTIREAISGCYDYFKWNDYFSHGGTDFCECGWFDRNYYGGAMSASLGSLNRNKIGYWGAWGFPNEVRKRFNPVSLAYGTLRISKDTIITGGYTRSIDVLYIYPKDLTSVEERFGSWMVQYGYTNYCPSDRVVKLGKLESGRLTLGTNSYSTIVVGFEPFYNQEFLSLLEKFVKAGGNVVWQSTPPANELGKVPARFLKLFGLKSVQTLLEGTCAQSVKFTGSLSSLPTMLVPTDMLPDRIYSVNPLNDVETVAFTTNNCIGTWRRLGRGNALYIGCRLRDDQSGATPDSPSTLFDLLKCVGAYGGTLSLDNTETISRKTKYFASKFNNGTYTVCNHFYKMVEEWDGVFRRDEQEDAKFLERYDMLTPLELKLDNFLIEGHRISYQGEGALQYRLNKSGKLIGFRGEDTCGVSIDGVEYRITKEKANTVFSVIDSERIPEGYKKGWQVWSSAPTVNLCCKIPKSAELYRDVDADGLDLQIDERIKLSGSEIHKGDIPSVVILVK